MKFLNVDLELKSSQRPRNIEREFDALGASILFSGEVAEGYLSTFEVNPSRDTPDAIILEFSRLMESFSEEAQKEWADATERVFDVGYESKESVQGTLKDETNKIIENLNAITRYTTYPPVGGAQRE